MMMVTVMVTLHFLLDALVQSCIIINRYPYQALRRGVECEKSQEKSHLNMHAFPHFHMHMSLGKTHLKLMNILEYFTSRA